MLRLLIGKAGTGKTGAVMEEIHSFVEKREGGSILLVPEQYSHEAERELCRVCGDTVSLYAEVFSFTGLARRVRSLVGGGAAPMLDKGGRLLCMSLALAGIGARLRVYSAAVRSSDLQSALLSAVDELKAARIGAERLLETAENCPGALGDKLRDLALVLESYDAVVANGHADPADALELLAAQIPESPFGAGTRLYIDGFTDFTAQETNVLTALLKNGAELTVCLTLDSTEGDNEIFALSRYAARSLLTAARELGIKSSVSSSEGEWNKSPALGFYTDKLFTYTRESYEGEGAVGLHAAENMAEECEFAAAQALKLVREQGCRWRDIAVAVRGYDDYALTLERVFAQYGVPLFQTRKSELLYKPLPLMISLIYELCAGGFATDDMLAYLRTGLTGLSEEDCDLLSAYVFKWQLKLGAWLREEDWTQHPEGYGCEFDEVSREKLERINALRRLVAAPLLRFRERSHFAHTALEHCAALAEYFDTLRLPDILEQRAALLSETGREEQAREYAQLWELIVTALEQCAAILGERPMEAEEFGKLFLRMLSQYELGTIPVSLDRVSAGDFDRMRRRHIKHLIVLGASDARLPQSAESGGVFTDAERRQLSELRLELGASEDAELWREFTLIYNCLTLPSESLELCYAMTGEDAAAQRPAFVFQRAAALFAKEAERVRLSEVRLSAEKPALLLAAQSFRSGTAWEKAAAEYFAARFPEKYATLRSAAALTRGRLSPLSVRSLYGEKLRLSASRIDKFASCKFAYFCRYGLKAKPYEPALFRPPEIGSFMHYVLEKTAREVKALGGFRKTDDETIKNLTDKYVEQYVKEELNDFREKSARFVYLFHRLCRDVRLVALDAARELRTSDFEPLSFELDFGNAEIFPPVELGDGQYSMTLTGIADRVDGWLHDGKLYLRVVDYKTGKKQFSMADIWAGMGLQLLLYLFALEEEGAELYQKEIVPAGVMYLPARNAVISAGSDLSEDEAAAERGKELRRSGLVLDDEAVLNAWENGEDKRYIPVRFKKGLPSPDDVASLERLGLLSKHIRKSLTEMAAQLRHGSIAADPYYRSQQENACLNCDYFDACHFPDGESGESCRHVPKLRPDKVWALLEGGEDNA